MTTRLFDFAVVGAGAAGSRAAELLATRGAAVLLLDPKAPWEKPCGGGLTAGALRHTPELRELDPEMHAVRAIKIISPARFSVVLPLRTPYHVISRLRLSQWGLERARRAGATFRPVGTATVGRVRDVWILTDTRGAVHRARWLIGTDGATSRVRRQLAPHFRPELAPTRVVYPQAGVTSGCAVFQIISEAKGYLWDFPRPGHHSIGVGVAPRMLVRDGFDRIIADYRRLDAGDESEAPGAGTVIATSLWHAGGFDDLGARNYALVGDAGGLADPALGEGLDQAFRSAALAVAAFDPTAGFSGYPDAARRSFAAECRRGRALRRWLYRGGLADWVVRRAQSSPRAARALAALVYSINEHESILECLVRAALLPHRSANDRGIAREHDSL
jgi:flavin-dependent dehydrogenase